MESGIKPRYAWLQSLTSFLWALVSQGTFWKTPLVKDLGKRHQKVSWEDHKCGLGEPQKQNLTCVLLHLGLALIRCHLLSSPCLNYHSVSTLDIDIHEIWWCLKLILQVLFGDKMFYSQTFFDHFIATKVCNRKLFHHICSNFLFTLSGFDRKNLNMVCVRRQIQKSNWFLHRDEESLFWIAWKPPAKVSFLSPGT